MSQQPLKQPIVQHHKNAAYFITCLELYQQFIIVYIVFYPPGSSIYLKEPHCQLSPMSNYPSRAQARADNRHCAGIILGIIGYIFL